MWLAWLEKRGREPKEAGGGNIKGCVAPSSTGWPGGEYCCLCFSFFGGLSEYLWVPTVLYPLLLNDRRRHQCIIRQSAFALDFLALWVTLRAPSQR